VPQLFADISSHGFGHLAQLAPVLNALRQSLPKLALTLRSGLPRQRLASRITGEFTHIAAASDFGFVMKNALDIDQTASAARYRDFHADWPARVAREAETLAALAPDLVLTGVAYLPLAGAAAAGIRAASLCSLNWADLFAHYFGTGPWAADIHAQMLAAYRSALFLRTTPAMPMTDLNDGTATVGPVADPVATDRPRIAAQLGLPADRRWVLVALGGFDFPLPAAGWPRRDDIAWLLPAAWQPARDDQFAIDSAAPFAELFACADALIAKPGYGTFVEAAVQGVPLLYLRRPDWPEEACLLDWIHRHARAAELGREAAGGEALLAALDHLWAMRAPPPPVPTGAAEAAGQLLRLLVRD
jgi:hypothetical protein